MAERVCCESGDGDCNGGFGSLRAIHDVLVILLDWLELKSESLAGSGSWVLRGFNQLFQLGCEQKGESVGFSIEMEEGLKTSSEPRGSLGKGGISEGDCFGDLSDCSIALSIRQVTKTKFLANLCS